MWMNEYKRRENGERASSSYKSARNFVFAEYPHYSDLTACRDREDNLRYNRSCTTNTRKSKLVHNFNLSKADAGSTERDGGYKPREFLLPKLLFTVF
jgi:hypothetical protein